LAGAARGSELGSEVVSDSGWRRHPSLPPGLKPSLFFLVLCGVETPASLRNNISRRAKAGFSALLSARLKSCPDTRLAHLRVFLQLVKSCPETKPTHFRVFCSLFNSSFWPRRRFSSPTVGFNIFWEHFAFGVRVPHSARQPLLALEGAGGFFATEGLATRFFVMTSSYYVFFRIFISSATDSFATGLFGNGLSFGLRHGGTVLVSSSPLGGGGSQVGPSFRGGG